jgi:hypothetical protein
MRRQQNPVDHESSVRASPARSVRPSKLDHLRPESVDLARLILKVTEEAVV